MGDVPRVPGLARTGYNAKARREHFLIPDREVHGNVGLRGHARQREGDPLGPKSSYGAVAG